FTLLTLQEKMERGKGSIGLLDRLLDVAMNRVRMGDAPEMILAQAEFELSRTKSDILGLKREYVSNLAELRVVLSLPPEQEVTLEGRLKKKVSLPDLKTLLESALRNRPDLAAQDAERRAAEAEVNLTRAERIPNLEFSVFYSREEGNFNIFGAGVSIPLPFFDRRQGELEQALARKSIADIEYRNLRQIVEMNLRSTWESYRISEAEIDLFGENVLEKFRKNLELIQQAYEEGQIEIFETITAQDRLIEAQVRYLDVLLAYHLARADLEREAALEW
ncbi:MAG: TolC family protein, partial [Deltaproteobacteria bacterium]|nr:TolC family protein [Deltaproteobacteria bacterium]